MKPGQAAAEFLSKDGRRVAIRALKRGDLDSLLRFAATVSKEKATRPDLGIVSLDRVPTRDEEKAFLDRILNGRNKGNVVSFAAFVGGEIVGHSDVWRRQLRDVRHSGVFGIVVRDGFRDIGIGERLMAEVLRESKRMGIWLVELTVFAINPRAIRLYEKMGFRKVGVIPAKIVRGKAELDEVVMYADLRGSDKSPVPRRGRG